MFFILFQIYEVVQDIDSPGKKAKDKKGADGLEHEWFVDKLMRKNKGR
jgi:hypothetical protein